MPFLLRCGVHLTAPRTAARARLADQDPAVKRSALHPTIAWSHGRAEWLASGRSRRRPATSRHGPVRARRSFVSIAPSDRKRCSSLGTDSGQSCQSRLSGRSWRPACDPAERWSPPALPSTRPRHSAQAPGTRTASPRMPPPRHEPPGQGTRPPTPRPPPASIDTSPVTVSSASTVICRRCTSNPATIAPGRSPITNERGKPRRRHARPIPYRHSRSVPYPRRERRSHIVVRGCRIAQEYGLLRKNASEEDRSVGPARARSPRLRPLPPVRVRIAALQLCLRRADGNARPARAAGSWDDWPKSESAGSRSWPVSATKGCFKRRRRVSVLRRRRERGPADESFGDVSIVTNADDRLSLCHSV
jgi:hypothetical protein